MEQKQFHVNVLAACKDSGTGSAYRVASDVVERTAILSHCGSAAVSMPKSGGERHLGQTSLPGTMSQKPPGRVFG